MDENNIIKYNYRWVILIVFSLIMAMQQLLWISFAPITSTAEKFYHQSDMGIGLLSLVFMVVYIIVSIPASWLIDTRGFRFSVGLGAILTGVFGLLRGLYADNYTLVLIFQIGIGIGQPLVVNAVTKVGARWFPIEERATASGIAWFAGYLGLIVGLALTPILVKTSGGIPSTLLIYGIISIVSMILFIVFAKEYPPTPQCTPEQEERALVFDGLKKMMSKKQFLLLAFIFFIGLGVFNGLSTWIEQILTPRGFRDEAGFIGGVMVGSGILGSAILPMLSDKFKNRSKFILLAMLGSIPGLIGITIADSLWLLIFSAIILGFFMLSAAPIGFQYGAELANPAPEGTSTGMLMMMGQISGIIFIIGMGIASSMKIAMIALIVLMIITMFLCIILEEPEVLSENQVMNEVIE